MQTDICIYGGTSAGVIAAVAAAKRGKRVVLIEPGRHWGGMSSGGLGWTDFGNKAAVGGMALEFYRHLGRLYEQDVAWKFEPGKAERTFRQMLLEHPNITRLLEHRIVGAEKEAGRITRIVLERAASDPYTNAPGCPLSGVSQVPVEAAMFIDASYEGDLLAAAGVSYTVGRESVKQYGEMLNGIRKETPHHQISTPVDPYIKPGEPSSGLLPLVQPGDGGTPGDGDKRVQAYNFRLCLTNNKDNRIPIQPPSRYDESRYELLARHVEGLTSIDKLPGLHRCLLKIDMVTRDKTDINNQGGVSTDYIGMNWDYPEAGYERRGQIWREHLDYTKGLLHFLATSARVPQHIRSEMRQWGLCKDEFQDTGGWPHQLYVREARRLVGEYVVTQHVCEHKEPCDDSIGLAAYTMDSHNCQRVVQNGVARNEGDVQVPPAAPYPISYRAVTPRRSECENLLVPVCLSATHIAFGSIRMEPVFMVLGQSAALAACRAMEEDTSVQDVNYAKLRDELLESGQVLAWDEKKQREAGGASPNP